MIFAGFECYNEVALKECCSTQSGLDTVDTRDRTMPEQDSSAIQRSYKLRFYPTGAQRKQLAVEFGTVRWIYNTALQARRDAWNWYGESNNYVSIGRAITELQRDPDFGWLKNATRSCGTQALIDLDKAYRNWWAGRTNPPKYKCRNAKQSIRYSLDRRKDNFKAGDYLKIPKLGKVKLKWSRLPTGRPKMATISRNPDGQYFVSVSIEESIERWPSNGKVVGVDMGIKDVAVTSDGWHSGAPKNTYRLARKLKLKQRALARKQKGSNRRKRARRQVARVQATIAKCRNDFLHKTSTRIVKSADVIVLEDLNVSGMMKNRRLSKAVADVGMFELRRQITYKAAWHGKQVVVVDRFFPSTKTCSGCGQLHDMPLSKRRMQCDCGLDMDRDENAAQNLKALGIASLNVDGDINRSVATAA